MANTSLAIFQNTLQKTDYWLKELMLRLEWDDRQKAYQALKGVLHALRDRLPIENVVKLGAQLPMLVRGFYYEGWVPAHTPIKVHSLEEFLNLILIYFHNSALADEIDSVEPIAKAVFEVLQEQISVGEIDHIRKVLPEPLALLWSVRPSARR